MYDLIRKKLDGKKVVLLGFGREGLASYSLIRKALPDIHLAVADQNESLRENALLALDPNVELLLGKNYLKHLSQFDVIVKTPGITLKNIDYSISPESITSQTELFLEVYSKQVIGVTGTKGKSTTASLLFHTLKNAGQHTLLLGNIGRPAFDRVEEILPETVIVYEMSSHQLEHIKVSPHISILLNLYQEHLDAYGSFLDYQLAKMNILKYQNNPDFFIYNADDDLILQRLEESCAPSKYFPFSFNGSFSDGCFISEDRIIFSRNNVQEVVLDLKKKRKLKGDHNVRNIMSVISACKILGIENEFIQEGIAGFTGLEHRMEFVGRVKEVDFYNDSIATIPEACMEAVKALGPVDTLILGGFDRGIDYSGLAKFLSTSSIRNFIITGEAGQRIRIELEPIKKSDQQLFSINHFDEFLLLAFQHTLPGSVCLLSPAAASYNEFQNFEMRGNRYKELILGAGERDGKMKI
jgi:UDP-N-acetylmuramoyl-L-alanine---L-glutamate ligase